MENVAGEQDLALQQHFTYKTSKFSENSNCRINLLFIICDVKIEERCITLATLYAPNDEEPTFYRIFFYHVLDFRCEDLIIGGDFNLVLDHGKDKTGGRAKTHTESVKVLQIFMAEHNLMDAWRILNPDSFQYTWRRKKTE